MRRLMLLALGVVAASTACSKQGSAPPVSATATLADSAEQVMINIHFMLTDKGVARGELFADTAYIFDENRRYDLRKVRTTFNTASGAKDGVMSADRGKYSLNQQVLEGYGNVVIVTNDGAAPIDRVLLQIGPLTKAGAFLLARFQIAAGTTMHLDLRQALEHGEQLLCYTPIAPINVAVTGYVFSSTKSQ